MNRTNRNRTATTPIPLLALAVLLGSLAVTPAVRAGDSADGTSARRTFESLQGLAGHWQGTSRSGKRVAIDSEIIGNGSAVVERFVFVGDDTDRRTDGTAGEVMLTVYHLDGDDLMLTHYCMAGNQPTMRATKIGDDEVRFELSGITNLSAPGAGHMHRAVVRFQGPDRFTTAWTFREGGEDRFTEVIEAERVAQSAARRR